MNINEKNSEVDQRRIKVGKAVRAKRLQILQGLKPLGTILWRHERADLPPGYACTRSM